MSKGRPPDLSQKDIKSKEKAFKGALSLSTITRHKGVQELRHAVLIHNQAVRAIKNFHDLYSACQRVKQKGTGSFSGEQDLLRAILLFACSGLDAVVKQLVQDAIECVLQHDQGAQREFQKFVERRLKKGSGDDAEKLGSSGNPMDVRLMSELLVSFDPRTALVSLMTRALCADSLQSRDQLLKVATHFALTREEVILTPDVTQEAFRARNQIVHEMDIDLESGNRRRTRNYTTMIEWSKDIVGISARFIDGVAQKIARPDAGDGFPEGS